MKSVLLICFFTTSLVFSQDLSEYNTKRSNIDQRLMLTLGSWATVNFTGGGIGWASSQGGEAKYFHQMNVMWNTVNLGLAIPGYIKAKRSNVSMVFSQTLEEQQRTEKILLFNVGLDVTYMTAGFLLRNEAKYNLEKRDQFNGFGNSLLLQGGFLFLFDIAAHAIHANHRKKGLNPIINRLSMSSTGIGFRWELN